jgi:hypothetical protein
MTFAVTDGIRRREFGASIPAEDIEVLGRAARASLATPIMGEGLPRGARLLKAYATSARGPRRVVFLLQVEDGGLFLLFYRDKNDAVGRNITLANPTFRRQLGRHLDLLLSDIEAGRIETFRTPP